MPPRKLDSYAATGPIRVWLYTIATTTSLNLRRARNRGGAAAPLAAGYERAAPGADESFAAREDVELAFMSTVSGLPPRQRAALILRDGLGWSVLEIAGLLGSSMASVNSALQRARATLDAKRARPEATPPSAALVERYIAAWESGDIPGLVALLREDVIASMPPMAEWFQGREAFGTFIGPRIGGPGTLRVVPLEAADELVLAVYRRAEGQTTYEAHGIQVVRAAGDAVAEIHAFLDPSLFPRFGLPLQLADR